MAQTFKGPMQKSPRVFIPLIPVEKQEAKQQTESPEIIQPKKNGGENLLKHVQKMRDFIL